MKFWKRRADTETDYTEVPETYTEAYTAGEMSYTDRIRQAIRRTAQTIRAVYGYSYSDAENVRSWLEKFPDVKRFERNRPIKRLFMAVCTAAAFISFYTRQPPRVTAGLSLLAAACLIWFDAGRLMSRILSNQSRALLASACLAWTVALRFPTLENLITAAGAVAVAFLAIRFFNVRWLSDQVYQRSETMKTALQDTPPQVIEDFWQGTGAAQVRALFYEMGLPMKNPHYVNGLKGVYTLGYAQCSVIKAETIDRAREVFRENAQLKADIERRDEELDRIVEYAKDYERHAEIMSDLYSQLETAQAAAEAGQKARDEAERLLIENARLQAQVIDLTIDLQIAQSDLEQLQAAADPNQEAGADSADSGTNTDVIPIEAIDTEEERREIKLAEAAALGYGVTRAAKFAGCTHWQSQQWYTKHPDEVAAGKAGAAEADQTDADAKEA